MRRLFRCVVWLGFLAAAGYAVSRILRSQSTLEQPTGQGWVPQASPPRQPVALKTDPPADAAPASPVEAPVVATEETSDPAPAKKAPTKKKAVAKKAAPAKDAPKKAPPKKA